jgi:hypothetical protein
MGLRLIQPVIEMSAKRYFWGVVEGVGDVGVLDD